MSIKDAAREVVLAHALLRANLATNTPHSIISRLQSPIDNLQRELNLDNDRTALAVEMHTRRQSDTVENAHAFREEFRRLLRRHEEIIIAAALGKYQDGTISGSYDALSDHLFGAMK
jgi:hypothetical protein